jgi:hypothetical protein
MMEDRYSPVQQKERRTVPAERVPEARYAYYQRCQIFRKGGEQCKAPAEKGALICHAHAGQLAMAVRRERERRAVLEEAVAEMRRRGRPEFEAKDLFMDFKGIQVTVAKMSQALIDGRIDCKTAGQLVVQLQTASKLLWLYHRGHRGARRDKILTTKDTKEHKGLPELLVLPKVLDVKAGRNWAANHVTANQREETRICLMAEVMAFADIRGRPHGPPEWARAA